MKHFAMLALAVVILVSGCVGQTPAESNCRLSLCDCSCHTGFINEDTGALCGINCARYGNGIIDCEIQNNVCTPIYNKGLQARYTCPDVCDAARANGVNLTDGPCLSELELYGWNVTDWVCDIAHEPRTAVDDQSQNQCHDYLNGIAHHFIELTPECEIIRSS